MQQELDQAKLENCLPLQEGDGPSKLKAKYPGGVIWVDCGISLQVQFPQFGIEVQEKALKIARELGASSQEEEANKVGIKPSLKTSEAIDAECCEYFKPN